MRMDVAQQAPGAIASDVKTMNYIEAITEGLREEMERDERIFLIGEDIASYGGVFKATKGLYEKFGPIRVIDSPISENFLVQRAVGAAMPGLIPSPDIQLDDLISLAGGRILEHASQNC